MPDFITLKLNSDFRRVYGRGKSCAGPVLVTYCLRNREGVCRFGITTSKKLGGAVQRNRCRRVIKEAAYHIAPLCAGGWDVVFVARVKTLHVKSTAVEREMKGQLKRLGVLEAASGKQQAASGRQFSGPGQKESV
ncbi:MAG: ribonuclease P protein component [Oscillospiraceae bacterium]|nr:ribonuclease P protein component [Oscillospiraceae bacterium]